jgi:hypothetical protein
MPSAQPARIRTATCTVFYGAGRKRYFTAAGAAKSIAAKAFVAKYGCECDVTIPEAIAWALYRACGGSQ